MPGHPERFLAGYEPPAGDTWFFDDPLQVESLLESFRDYARQGPAGYAWETVAVLQPWSFRLADISMPVHLWHGAQDPRVPLATREFAAETTPHAHFTSWPDAGHFGAAKYWSGILDAVP